MVTADDGRPAWMERAACRDLPTDLFFPADSDTAGAERATAVCRTCPVRKECAAYALPDPNLYGVWGASTEAQRRNRRRQRRPEGLARGSEPSSVAGRKVSLT